VCKACEARTNDVQGMECAHSRPASRQPHPPGNTHTPRTHTTHTTHKPHTHTTHTPHTHNRTKPRPPPHLDDVCAVVVEIPQLAVVALVRPPKRVLAQHRERLELLPNAPAAVVRERVAVLWWLVGWLVCCVRGAMCVAVVCGGGGEGVVRCTWACERREGQGPRTTVLRRAQRSTHTQTPQRVCSTHSGRAC
jgi:hypothetical protein